MPLSREDQLTIACVRYFKVQYPNDVIYHVANQRKTSRFRGGKLKKMGVLAGVSDLHIKAPKGGYLGLIVELKYEKNDKGVMKRANYPDEAQRSFLRRMHQYGYAVAVCWNLDEFIEVVTTYMAGCPVACEYLIENGHLTEEEG